MDEAGGDGDVAGAADSAAAPPNDKEMQEAAVHQRAGRLCGGSAHGAGKQMRCPGHHSAMSVVQVSRVVVGSVRPRGRNTFRERLEECARMHENVCDTHTRAVAAVAAGPADVWWDAVQAAP